VDFRASNMKLTGKLKHSAKGRWSEDDDAVVEMNRMKVAMIHRDGARLLMVHKTKCIIVQFQSVLSVYTPL